MVSFQLFPMILYSFNSISMLFEGPNEVTSHDINILFSWEVEMVQWDLGEYSSVSYEVTLSLTLFQCCLRVNSNAQAVV